MFVEANVTHAPQDVYITFVTTKGDEEKADSYQATAHSDAELIVHHERRQQRHITRNRSQYQPADA
jgi:hypothetical protein